MPIDLFSSARDMLGALARKEVSSSELTEIHVARIETRDGEEVPYFSNMIYSMLAIFCGLPSTAFPAGRESRGLPLGLQAIGPYLEDRTTLRFAERLEERWFCFERPPGF